MQAHPLLYRPSAVASYNFDSYVPVGSQFFGVSQSYGSDAYVPWNFGRNRWNGMGDVGDSRAIGYLPQWEASYLQTGNKSVRRAVIASGLGQLGFPVNYRDSSTNTVPLMSATLGRSLGNGFPYTGSTPFANYDYYGWDFAHSPAVGLMPFLCRPSPCFIELAQKVAMYQGLGSGDGDQKFDYWFATRGRAC